MSIRHRNTFSEILINSTNLFHRPMVQLPYEYSDLSQRYQKDHIVITVLP